MACPALPTCGLAVAESERVIPSILDRFETELRSLGLGDVPLTIRMTGCPNGCARPYTADLAFVGRSLDLYNVYVGGSLAGDRLVDLYRADVPTGELLEVVSPLLAQMGRRAARRRGTRRLLPADHATGRTAHGAHGPGNTYVRAGAAAGWPVSRALVLAAHGSRRDKAVNAHVRQIAESLRARRIFDEVAAAFHQGEPGFDEVLDELRADEITVVPLFTSAGHFTQVVLPEALAR